jgi:hypothetical protein
LLADGVFDAEFIEEIPLTFTVNSTITIAPHFGCDRQQSGGHHLQLPWFSLAWF